MFSVSSGIQQIWVAKPQDRSKRGAEWRNYSCNEGALSWMLHDILRLSQPIPNWTWLNPPWTPMNSPGFILKTERLSSLCFVQATGQAKSRLGVGVHVASYSSEEGA